MEIKASTEIYCIFGNPVRHSLSPVIHNTAFGALGMDALYCAFEPESIENAVMAMRHLGIRGASVTIPFKVSVIPCLDGIDPLARSIGAVNTLLNDNGTITGYNTDGLGAVSPLEKRIGPLSGKKALVVGNGGSARAIAFALLSRGARVVIAGRNPSRAASLAADLGRSARSSAIDSLDPGFMSEIDIVINTTPVGMTPDTKSTPIEEKLLLPHHTVFDIVYSPDRTRLLALAEAKGCVVVRGVEMLVSQALAQFKIWTGKDAPERQIYDAVDSHLKK